MQNYQRYRVWKEAQKLADDVYRFSTSLPQNQSGELQSQLRRVATLLPENLAENSAGKIEPDSGRFIVDSLDSLNELESLFFLSRKMGFANQARIDPTLTKLGSVKKQVIALRKTLVAIK